MVLLLLEVLAKQLELDFCLVAHSSLVVGLIQSSATALDFHFLLSSIAEFSPFYLSARGSISCCVLFLKLLGRQFDLLQETSIVPNEEMSDLVH